MSGKNGETRQRFNRRSRVRGVLSLITASLLVTLAACNTFTGLNVTRGSGEIISEARDISGVSEVVLAGSGDVNINLGDTESLTITTYENILPLLTSEVSNGRLSLGTQSGTSIQTDQAIVYELTLTDLSALEIAGSADVTLNEVDTDALSITISGSGEIIATGTAERLSLLIAGAGNVRAFDLPVNEAVVTIAGSGDVEVNATDRLEVSIAGSGNITYMGSPTLSESISGSGNIRAR